MDYTTLTTPGNIGFYNCAEVTEIFLFNKRDKKVFNFYTLVVFEEVPYSGLTEEYLGDRIEVDNDHFIGIKRYYHSIAEIEEKYSKLKSNIWSSDNINFSSFPELKELPKQYIPSGESNRINNALKNNFHCGSYIIEFFDEDKTEIKTRSKVNEIDKLNKICDEISQVLPINLSVVNDRIGNFIFQFPITILETNSRAKSTWDGVEINFEWHKLINEVPECYLQVESSFDKNYMGSIIEDYNKSNFQEIFIGNLDQSTHIKIWRKEPTLLISSKDGSYIRYFKQNMALTNHEKRRFEINGSIEEFEISSVNFKDDLTKIKYNTHINNFIYENKKKELEKQLSFKQYRKVGSIAKEDLRELIHKNDRNGVFLWDPFLRPEDIIQTLFYSPTANVPLRAIGSINQTVKNVYNKKGQHTNDIINDYKSVFNNPKNNNYQLNLEFRIQHTEHGWGFHDRFLIFPGDQLKRPKVYSLGTSINSYGENHHILQEVSYPQPVVDAFIELWNELENENCLVWKYPKD